jgi:carboxylesterase
MAGLADILYDNGFSIYNLRLKGHGLINEEKMFSAKLNDWESQLENAYLDLKSEFDEVHFCGLSLGASLILDLALKYENIGKIVIYSPMLKIRQWYACMAGIARFFVKRMEPSKPDCSIKADITEEFVSFFPVSQGYEAYRLANKVRARIPEKGMKGLCFLAKNDHDLVFEDHLKIMRNSGMDIVILEKSFHLIPVDVEKEFVFEKTLEYFKS